MNPLPVFSISCTPSHLSTPPPLHHPKENCGVYNFQNKVLTPRVQISGFLREDGKILLRVIDNGSGISYEELPLLRRRLELTFDETGPPCWPVKRRRKAILPPKSKDCLKNAPPV